MELEIIMLSEIMQSQKGENHVVSPINEIKVGFTVVESRMVTRGRSGNVGQWVRIYV
jgi:hypothetical protein